MKLIIFQCALLVIVCHAKTVKDPCSQPPKGYELILEKCISENLNHVPGLLNKFVEDPFIDFPEVKKCKVCILEGIGFIENGKISVSHVESFLDKWIVSKDARERIKKVGKDLAEKANQEVNTLDVAHVYFNSVLAVENKRHLIQSQIC